MIFAVMMVRNEVDILRANLLHHLHLGVDRILVVDDGSTDGTEEVLRELSKTGRVYWERREGRFEQAETTTELAREAFLRGARWVLPTDADEFWWVAGGKLRDVLAASSAGALEAEVVNFVQRREQEVAEARALLTMTRRVAEPIGSVEEGPELVTAGRIAFVEMRYPPKCVSRASIALSIAQGNHAVSGVNGAVEKTHAIVCLHAPLRSRSILLSAKVEHGRRVEEIQQYLRQAWHVRRWRRLAKAGRLDEEWAANSYLDDGLDVSGEKHPVTTDLRLRDVVAPWFPVTAVGHATRATPVEAAQAKSVSVAPAWEGEASPGETGSIVARMRDIEGWLRDEEAELLVHVTRQALKEHPAGAIVEIGSYCGKSTIVLAAAAKNVSAGARVYAIDPHRGEIGATDGAAGLGTEASTLERFRANVSKAGVADVVEPIVERSDDVVWSAPIGLLFVDGLHDYASVSHDFSRFEPFLPKGAYAAFHDCDETHPGVRACVEGVVAAGGYREVARGGSVVVLQKEIRPEPSADVGDPEELASLRLRAAQQEKGIAFLLNEVAARERVIREREQGIDWLRSVVANHEATIAEREKGIAWLRELLQERDESIRWLQSEASRGAAELEQLRKSKIWRILRFWTGAARK